MTSRPVIAILGTVGVPGRYGGFETLAENLVRQHGAQRRKNFDLAVFCSARAYPDGGSHFEGATLRYVPLDANGMQSILYDIWSLFGSVWRKDEAVLLLGVSGALALPFVRLISRTRVVTNIDGIEWKREKWTGLARTILRVSEWAAVRYSHVVVVDNQAIADHVQQSYGRPCTVIAYGGDHALATDPAPLSVTLPDHYALALCRIEPENNVAMILEAFASMAEHQLVFVGNWDRSRYGRRLRAQYGSYRNLHLLDPIYDPGRLRTLRNRARLYVHGHSAGGTNPSLVEMMHFGVPILAHGCTFNRYTTVDGARYFLDARELVEQLRSLAETDAEAIGTYMKDIADHRYTWPKIAQDYFSLFAIDA